MQRFDLTVKKFETGMTALETGSGISQGHFIKRL
jgi:hypothetical protein